MTTFLNRIIKVSYFLKPNLKNNTESFNRGDIESLIDHINSTPYIDVSNYKISMHRIIACKINCILEYSPQELADKCRFTSEIQNSEYKADLVLCIDEDLEIHAEELVFDAPVIYVKSRDNKKRKVACHGKNPVINFSKHVKCVIYGERLVLSTRNLEDVAFINVKSIDFERSNEFFRIEYICINTDYAENLTFNNQFIELIAYVNPDFGSIEVNEEFNITCMTSDIKLKLFFNEHKKEKEEIIRNYNFIRNYETVDEYLSASGKANISSQIRKCLNSEIINLPSIIDLIFSNSFRNTLFTKNEERRRSTLK